MGEYVHGQAHTNGIENFWALVKRGHKGGYNKNSPKHLHLYVNEFATRHDLRLLDTLDQMREMIRGLADRRLQYKDLIANNGLPSGARPG